MSSDKVFVVMRHSTRLDISNPDASWSDKTDRPYDPPISGFELAELSAGKLKSLGIDIIVTSPMRRCVQTAGIMARSLGVFNVVVDFGLSEVMHAVRTTGVSNDRTINNTNDQLVLQE